MRSLLFLCSHRMFHPRLGRSRSPFILGDRDSKVVISNLESSSKSSHRVLHDHSPIRYTQTMHLSRLNLCKKKKKTTKILEALSTAIVDHFLTELAMIYFCGDKGGERSHLQLLCRHFFQLSPASTQGKLPVGLR